MLRACLAALLLMTAPVSAQTLREQVLAGYETARGYADLRTARRDGWRPFGGEAALMGRHYSRRDGPDYVSGQTIDFSRPSNLIYSEINGQPQLVALAYVVRKRPDEPLPAGFAGGDDVWHVHDGPKFLAAVRESYPLIGGLAERWFSDAVITEDGKTDLAMVHLWLIPNPKGRFASHNPALAYRELGLPLDWADTDMEVAQGLAIAGRDGCENALDAELWIAGVSGATRRAMMRTCEALAAEVRANLGGGEAAVEARAKAAWRRLEDLRLMTLTPAELARIDAFVEDGPGVCR